MADDLIFRARKLVKPEDLNARNTLFGGRLMSWIDEECGIYCACQMGTPTIITKYISELDFKAPAYQGDVIEIGVATVDVGRTSLTVRCVARDKATKREIIAIDKIVFVALSLSGRATRHELAHKAGQKSRDVAEQAKLSA